jgi:hypothetical protein
MTDKGYDSEANRAAALARGITPVIPRRENSKQRGRWTERLRRVVSDRGIGVAGGQVYPFEPAAMRRPVGTSTKGDHHVAIT